MKWRQITSSFVVAIARKTQIEEREKKKLERWQIFFCCFQKRQPSPRPNFKPLTTLVPHNQVLTFQKEPDVASSQENDFSV